MSEKQQRSDDAAVTAQQPNAGFFEWLWLFLCAGGYRYLCELIFIRIRLGKRSFWAAQKPDRTVVYPVRPTLRHRIFIPADHTDGIVHPVYFLIHGVAYIVGTPSMDDQQARSLADKHKYVVVALSYRRSPEFHFPTPIYDIAAIIGAVLNDKSLPIDTNKVVVGGFSSGASITLAVAQLPELKHRIKAVVPFQPLTDRSGEVRGSYPKEMPWGGPDDMEKTKTLSDWAYPLPGQDLKDKLLSPYHATRTDIPQPICLITGSADMLCKEGYMTACKLAGRPAGNDFTTPWEQNQVKYWCAKDMPHGWTHFWIQLKGQWRDKQLEAQDDAWKEVSAWLEKVL